MSEPTSTPYPHRANRPVYAFGSLAVMVGALTALYLTDHADGAGLFVALIIANLPTLVAAVASEQAARDIRNGTVKNKAKQGALEAIEETGVMTRTGPVATAQLAALNATLDKVHELAAANSRQLDEVQEAQQSE